MRSKIRYITVSAVIAALYVALTYLTQFMAFGPLQLRIAESLTVLPYFSSAGIWGVTLGCMISNIISPYGILDLIFGSLATLLAAIITRLLSKLDLWYLAPLPPVLINGIVIGLLLSYESGVFAFSSFLMFFLEVSAGQVVPCYVIGLVLILLLRKNKDNNIIKIHL